jgi:hypothetical protein
VGDGDIEALARCCVEATLRHIEGSSDALGRVSALLDDAMTSLRRSLSAATGAEDHAECRRDLEAAMVALQSEDALAPLLDSARERILQTIDVLRFVVTPRRGETDASGPGGRDRLACEAMAARLRLAVIALDAGIARSGRVRQTRAIVGAVDLSRGTAPCPHLAPPKSELPIHVPPSHDRTTPTVDDSPSIRQVIRGALASGGRPESRT